MPRLALLANIREIWYGLYSTSVHLFLLPELYLSNTLHNYNSTCSSSCSDSVYWLSNQETGIQFRTGQKLSSTQHSVASGVMAAGTSRRLIVPMFTHTYNSTTPLPICLPVAMRNYAREWHYPYPLVMCFGYNIRWMLKKRVSTNRTSASKCLVTFSWRRQDYRNTIDVPGVQQV